MVRSPPTPVRPLSLRFVAVPFLLYLLHALLFGGWIVDDAGISFVYARNLAAGHGLVAQPGLPPVEGFSNFLWVLLLAPLLAVRLFDPVLTPKLVSAALVAASFLLLHRSLVRLDPAGRTVSLVTLSLLALNTSFVVWTVSGLENPLYVCLICLLFALLARERTESPSWRLSLAAGAVTVGIAMTRPDGILFAALYPLLTLFAQGRPIEWRAAGGRSGRFAVAFAVLFGGFLLFRALYFGDLYPNTYHAKGGPTGESIVSVLTFHPRAVEELVDLAGSAAGRLGGPVLVALVVGAAFLAGRGRLRWVHGAVLAFAGWAAAAYLLLPRDWMAEHRFATPFYPFFYAGAALVAVELGREILPGSGRRRSAGRLAACGALGLALVLFIPRSLFFAAQPTVPFTEVEARFGQRFNRFADALGLANGSFLLPDVGGALWSSRLRIYDLGGLTDPTIARTLAKDRRAFHHYVFEVARPTFIHTHGYWTAAGALEADPRFRRDYVPLYLYSEPAVLGMTQGRPFRSGDFVRRDAITGKDEAVRAIRVELVEEARRRAGNHDEGTVKTGSAGRLEG